MSLLARLIQRLTPDEPPPEREPEDRLAVAALLIHVARVDGSLAGAERAALAAWLGTHFTLDPERVEALIAAGDRMDREVDDVAALVGSLGREMPEAERRQLLAAAYRVASADGRLHEFEADWAWRLGRLLGLDEQAGAAARAEAER